LWIESRRLRATGNPGATATVAGSRGATRGVEVKMVGSMAVEAKAAQAAASMAVEAKATKAAVSMAVEAKAMKAAVSMAMEAKEEVGVDVEAACLCRAPSCSC
jgi:hypothetical protein